MADQPKTTKHQAAISSALEQAAKRRWPGEGTRAMTGGKTATKEFYEIPASWICIDEKQVRQSGKDTQADSLQELARDIEENGLMHPVVVEEIGQDKFQVLFGERRFVAMNRLLNWETILCRITTIEDHKRRFSQLSENLHREDLAAFDISDAVGELMREHELTLAQLAKKLHKSEPWVQRAITVTRKLTPEARELLLGSEAANSLVAIYYIATAPATEQKKIAKAVANGSLTQRKIIALTNEAKKASPETNVRGRRNNRKPASFEKRINIDAGSVTLKLRESNASQQHQITALEQALAILADDSTDTAV